LILSQLLTAPSPIFADSLQIWKKQPFPTKFVPATVRELSAIPVVVWQAEKLPKLTTTPTL